MGTRVSLSRDQYMGKKKKRKSWHHHGDAAQPYRGLGGDKPKQTRGKGECECRLESSRTALSREEVNHGDEWDMEDIGRRRKGGNQDQRLKKKQTKGAMFWGKSH